MQGNGSRIRVLVVDDSAVMRKLVSNLLARDDEIEVIGTAIDGVFALNKVEQLNPDVVTLDVDMPRVDGLTALKEIVAQFSTPVVMLSSLTTRGARLAMQSLEMGAVDFVCKPKVAAQIGDVAEELIGKVKAAARSKMVAAGGEALTATNGHHAPLRRRARKAPIKLVAIGASSGGPSALRYLLPKIPAEFPAGIVIAQHMPESFTSMFAKWLDEICAIKVREARDGSLAAAGCALIAPGDAHLKVKRRTTGAEARLDRGELVNGHRPSVDVLFQSVAEEYGEQAMGVIMTGMGSDGAAGLGLVKKAGGHTVAQDEASCMIYGMPKVAIKRGFVDQVVALNELSAYLRSVVRVSE